MIATAALAEVRRRAPDAEIGVLTPSWNAVVFERQPQVSRLYHVDHWRLQRGGGSLARKARVYMRTVSATIAELRRLRYDLSIDLYPYYPNMAGITWRARVPRRIGFTSGGRGALHTETLDWVDDRRHIALKHRDLLRLAFGADRLEAEPVHYELGTSDAPTVASVRSRIAAAGISGRYVVVHPGAGTRQKKWPAERWANLITAVRARGYAVVLTGVGATEASEAQPFVDRADPPCTSFVGALSWTEFVQVVTDAAAVLSSDTVAGHVAAAVGTPAVALFTGIDDLAQWRPAGARVMAVINPVPCAPCFRRGGCETMACIRGIGVQSVLDGLTAISESPL